MTDEPTEKDTRDPNERISAMAVVFGDLKRKVLYFTGKCEKLETNYRSKEATVERQHDRISQLEIHMIKVQDRLAALDGKSHKDK